MKHQEIVASLNHIRPKAEWTLSGDDYKNLVWLSNDDSPTFDEIKSGWISYQEKLRNDELELLAKKEAALVKLAALGLDEDDLKVLGLA